MEDPAEQQLQMCSSLRGPGKSSMVRQSSLEFYFRVMCGVAAGLGDTHGLKQSHLRRNISSSLNQYLVTRLIVLILCQISVLFFLASVIK